MSTSKVVPVRKQDMIDRLGVADKVQTLMNSNDSSSKEKRIYW